MCLLNLDIIMKRLPFPGQDSWMEDMDQVAEYQVWAHCTGLPEIVAAARILTQDIVVDFFYAEASEHWIFAK